MISKYSLKTAMVGFLLLASHANAWPGITRGQMVDLESTSDFKTDCSYRVFTKENGTSNEVDMVSSDRLIFDALIDDPNVTGKNKRKIVNTFTINADAKMKAVGTLITGPFSSQHQKVMKAGEFEITMHSCVKFVEDRKNHH